MRGAKTATAPHRTKPTTPDARCTTRNHSRFVICDPRFLNHHSLARWLARYPDITTLTSGSRECNSHLVSSRRFVNGARCWLVSPITATIISTSQGRVFLLDHYHHHPAHLPFTLIRPRKHVRSNTGHTAGQDQIQSLLFHRGHPRRCSQVPSEIQGAQEKGARDRSGKRQTASQDARHQAQHPTHAARARHPIRTARGRISGHAWCGSVSAYAYAALRYRGASRRFVRCCCWRWRWRRRRFVVERSESWR